MSILLENIRLILENDRSKFDVGRLQSIAETLASALADMKKLKKLSEKSDDPRLRENEKKLWLKIDKYHKLFSEVYKDPKYSLKEDNEITP